MSRLVTTLALLATALPAIADTTAIVGGKVHTVGPMGTIENGTVLIVDGRIAAVGEDVEQCRGDSLGGGETRRHGIALPGRPAGVAGSTPQVDHTLAPVIDAHGCAAGIVPELFAQNPLDL